MKTAITSVVALVVGLLVGIALFDHSPGIENAVVALALATAIAAAFADNQFRSRHSPAGARRTTPAPRPDGQRPDRR